ncbi:MAG: alanine racemase [Deltaproteobacteria bacterium]|nr:alanine racemase [Deltaproteobacteria bacterium]
MTDTPLIWAEIDLDAVAANVRELRRITRPAARLLVAVKANAYGHGLVEIACHALQHGADTLGVARLPEALALRDAGIDAPVLIFGYTPPTDVEALVRHDLVQTVYRPEAARAYAERIGKSGARLKVHLKVDTGMGRLGILPDARRYVAPGMDISDHAVREVLDIAGLTELTLEGIFTHFASSDSADKRFAEEQFGTFMAFLEQLKRSGLEFEVRHAANSGAIIDMPHTHLDMVRAGVALYGLYPSAEVDKSKIDLTPVMTLKARIVHLKQVPAGFPVSYGMTHTTPAPTVIATVPVGYADGFNRRLSNRGHMLVRGQKAPIVGRVCMDLTMIDVGHIPGVALEDEVVILGRQAGEAITAEDIADLLDTINYEITSAITARVPRLYLKRE